MAHVLAVALVVLAACGSTSAPAPASRPAPAVSSPGPLTTLHAGVACYDCHVNDSKDLDNNKCIACHQHQPLALHIRAGKGLHASAVVRGKPCQACHLEHRGASADILGWKSMTGGRDGFDHDLTGWPLDGAHRDKGCDSCHANGYVGTDRLCASCHPTNPHAFTRREMQACDRCHTTSAWAPPRPQVQLMFNHNDRRDARMPLLGKHLEVACATCHPAGRFGLTPPTSPVACEGCHQTPHAGHLFGTVQCDHCHSPTMPFKQIAFDHSERTKFDLGRHDKLACMQCHTTKQGSTKLDRACEQCHAARSPHKNRFDAFGKPPACAKCHSPGFTASGPRSKWPVNVFDHGKHTPFKLTGRHANIPCAACHRVGGPVKFEKLAPASECMSCHEHRKAHVNAAHPDGQFTNAQCSDCHK